MTIPTIDINDYVLVVLVPTLSSAFLHVLLSPSSLLRLPQRFLAPRFCHASSQPEKTSRRIIYYRQLYIVLSKQYLHMPLIHLFNYGQLGAICFHRCILPSYCKQRDVRTTLTERVFQL
ncbi:hypothetical protein BYT27DRAFT_7157634, partial [Phlegmacium glaucopus]